MISSLPAVSLPGKLCGQRKVPGIACPGRARGRAAACVREKPRAAKPSPETARANTQPSGSAHEEGRAGGKRNRARHETSGLEALRVKSRGTLGALTLRGEPRSGRWGLGHRRGWDTTGKVLGGEEGGADRGEAPGERQAASRGRPEGMKEPRGRREVTVQPLEKEIPAGVPSPRRAAPLLQPGVRASPLRDRAFLLIILLFLAVSHPPPRGTLPLRLPNFPNFREAAPRRPSGRCSPAGSPRGTGHGARRARRSAGTPGGCTEPPSPAPFLFFPPGTHAAVLSRPVHHRLVVSRVPFEHEGGAEQGHPFPAPSRGRCSPGAAAPRRLPGRAPPPPGRAPRPPGGRCGTGGAAGLGAAQSGGGAQQQKQQQRRKRQAGGHGGGGGCEGHAWPAVRHGGSPEWQ